MIGTASVSMRPVTVAPSRIAGGGSVKPTLTSNVRVTAIGLRRNLANAPARRYRRIIGQAHRDLRISRCRPDQLSRHIEDRVAAVLAREPDDHLPGLNDFARHWDQSR